MNNINIDKNKIDLSNNNNIVEVREIKNNTSKLNEEGDIFYDGTRYNLEDRENNIDDVNYVYFPSDSSRKDPSHVFLNIIQPRKPLSFLPLDISSFSRREEVRRNSNGKIHILYS
jgi:hypothetical protein